MGDLRTFQPATIRPTPPNYRTVSCCASCKYGSVIRNAGDYCDKYHVFEAACGLCDDWQDWR